MIADEAIEKGDDTNTRFGRWTEHFLLRSKNERLEMSKMNI